MGAVDDLIAQKQGGDAPSGSAVDALIAKKNPSAPNPFLAGALGAAKKIVSPVSAALNYQHDALAEAAFHKHSPDANRAALRHAIPGFEKGYDDPRLFGSGPGTPGVNVHPGVTHFVRGAEDTALDTLADPLTYETLGVSAVPKIAGKVAGAGLKALQGTPFGSALYDFLHWGGPVARARGPEAVQLIRGADNAASATGSRVQKHLVDRFHSVTKGLSDEDKVTVAKALNGEIAHEMPGVMPDHLKPVYRQLRTLTELDFKLRSDSARAVAFNQLAHDLPTADRDALARAFARSEEPVIPTVGKRSRVYEEGVSVRQRTRQINDAPGPLQGPGISMAAQRRAARVNTPPITGTPGYKMPPANAAEVERAKKLNELYHQIRLKVEQAMPRREDYMPWAHEAADEGAGTEARTVNKLDRADPRTFERENLEVTHAGQLQRGFSAMAANTGRQVERGMLHTALGDLVNDPHVHSLFDKTLKATGAMRTDVEKAKDAWLAMVGYPRAATVSLTPRHAVNILDLLTTTVGPSEAPKVLKDTMALAAKLAVATPKQHAALTAEGRQLGALSGEFAERKPFFQEFSSATVPERVPFTNVKTPEAVAGKPVLGPLAGKKIPVLSTWTQLNNKLVWAVDEAAKQTYAKLIVSRGEAEGLRAGGLASSRLVDYAHHSPLVSALRNVAPFGTFRGSIPGAVAGGIARNPMRAAVLDRATGGSLYGDKPDHGGHGVTLYNPTADVGRALPVPGGVPGEYVRATLAAPAQALGTLALEAVVAGRPGASVQTVGEELQDAPGALAHGKLPSPRKDRSKYADAVALRHSRFLTYGNPVDLRWLLSAAVSGVPEARDALTEMGYGQFKPKGVGKGLTQQVLGVGVR